VATYEKVATVRVTLFPNSLTLLFTGATVDIADHSRCSGRGKAIVRLVAIIGVFVSVLLMTGCAGAGWKSSVAVELSEWVVEPAKLQVPNGKVVFTAINNGTVEHELIVLETDLAPNALVISGEQVDVAASGTIVASIQKEQLGPGFNADLTLELEAGNYVLFCNIPNHYESGQAASFRVFTSDF
jgi:uncharacterized cupredoxin-like copper-binding protein